MAGNNTIQILRGTNAKIAASTDTLKPGQLLYNIDKGYLTCGGGATDLVNKLPVKAAELIVYNND